MTELDKDKVWNIVRETRNLFLLNYKNAKCDYHYTLLTKYNIKQNINALSKRLNLTPTSVVKRNISQETLQFSFEIFTYLNFCPPKFYFAIEHIVKTGTPKEIILGLTLFKSLSPKISTILRYLMKNLNLTMFEKIQIITKGKCSKIDNGSCSRLMEITNNETLKVLGF